MTGTERRASLSLAFIYAMRMLGLFLVLPVFALEAPRYPGGDDPALVGLAMGIYGLTQGLLQLPFGMASDRLGRKRVIVFGLLIFAAGSALAASADTLAGLVVGRCLQGAGAVSAVVTALLADLTRDTVRTKAMALVGASIGLMFALSLVMAPALAARFGLGGLFALTAALATVAIAIVLWVVPPEPPRQAAPARGSLRTVLAHRPTLRLNFGVFILHAVLLAMWVAVPRMLVDAGLAQADHWWIYLPTIGASFFVMSATLFPLERRGYLRAVFLSAVGLIALVQLALAGVAALQARDPALVGLGVMGALLFFFFCASNILEASQPSIASRAAPPEARGAALGFYNTLQSLGFFAGGAAGGALLKAGGSTSLFLACGAAVLAWLLVAWPMEAQAAVARAARPETT
jgi:MFS family permease